ncbi:MAG TPA: hypothetical protein VG266_02320, partial [Candidatus Dormibacteraeota bacterium]|nr:hypothetical protein [Candidatus Dormibacteraeota bacterium]
MAVSGSPPPRSQTELFVTLSPTTVGNTAFETLTLHSAVDTSGAGHNVPTRPPGRYCYYSEWRLIRVNAVSRERKYGVYIYNACDGDRQIFPVS